MRDIFINIFYFISLFSNNCTNVLIICYLCFSTKLSEYYIDVIGNHGENLVALLHDTDLHILNPARNLVDKL